MKIRNNLTIIAALCCAVFVLGACSYENSSDGQGSIRINFENSGARYAVDGTAMSYTITLTSPGKNTINKKTEQGATSDTIPVPEGTWNIQVGAEGTRVIGRGETTVPVTAGQTASATIKMTVTGTRVSSWEELMADLHDTTLPNILSTEILTSFDTTSSSPIIDNKKVITLWAGKNVTITRSSNLTGSPVFTIKNCTLILDGTQGGTIEINGDRGTNTNCKNALINVEANSTLKMLNGVTITNNISAGSGGYGGGVYVKDGTFFMEGGVISGNTAKTNGGGVYINSGTFTKTGGIIYGYDANDSKSNVVSDNGRPAEKKGHAVYSSNKYSDSTLDENTPWSTSP